MRSNRTYRTDRIPPPPPIAQEEEIQVVEEREKTAWILRVRCYDKQGGSTLVKIQVLPDMTASTLSVCLSQAVTAHSPVPLDPIAGLFDQRDGIFYSLEYILSLPEPPLQYSFSVIRPLKREQPKKHSWSLVEIFLLIGVVATLIAAYFYGIDCLGYLWMILLEFTGWSVESSPARFIMAKKVL